MWLDAIKATLAIGCCFVAATILRRQLAVMSPVDQARFNRRLLTSLLLSAAMIGALTLYMLNTRH